MLWHVICLSQLLHPSRRKRYLEVNWAEAWRDPAIDAVREMWEKKTGSHAIEDEFDTVY